MVFNGAENTTVDVNVTIPTGWTNPACGNASTSVGNRQVGTVVPNWTCTIETVSGHQVLHWTGPQISPTQTFADSAQFFTFTVTVPSPTTQTSYGAFSGPEGFFVVQKYADGATSIWKSPNNPAAGEVATGLIRTVAGTSPPTPTPTPLPAPVVRASDGKIVFISARDGNGEIYLMNADGTGVTRLTTNPAVDEDAVLSPDGTRIAFGSNRDGNNEIYLMNADGTGLTRLTNNPARDVEPAFSPDGTKITFTTQRFGNNENNEIAVMNADGSSGALNLTNNPAKCDTRSHAVSGHADGRVNR